MKVSGFSFIRNGNMLGFPYIQSIQSALPLVDEFVIAVGMSQDGTLETIKSLNNPKIKIIETIWNDNMRQKGYVYGQQKMIAQYACTGDWALYIEGDEILHEKDYVNIRQAMETHLHNDDIEALAFDYTHFYGNASTIAWTPAFYRREARMIKTSVRSYAPGGLYWRVLDKHNRRTGRYPKAALANAMMYHYGWIRQEEQMIEKLTQVEGYWNKKDQAKGFKYDRIDANSLQLFTGTHPAAINGIYKSTGELFKTDKNHILTRRERKNRIGLKLEKWFGLELSKKHFKLVKDR